MNYIVKILLLSWILFSPFINAATTEPQPEKDIFQLSTKRIDPNTILLTWHIKPGNFLYKSRFSFKPSQHQTLGPINFPKTDVEKRYPNKSYRVYRDTVSIPLYLLNDKSGTFPLIVSHQGCSDSGFCYPPTENRLKLKINKHLEIISVKLAPPPTKIKVANKKAALSSSVDTPYQTLFEDHNIFFIIFSFYGFGLLLAFTPCILPMVPVLSGIIVGQHKNISSKRGLLLSISYVLGMALTYALVGIIIAAAGQNLQTLFQSPITIGFFAILFVVLALAMFDFYNLTLPQSWQAKIAAKSNSQNNGAYWGAFSMGALSTLILSPCVTAPLVGALSYIAKTSDMVLGGFALLFLGFGIGTPLIIVGTSAGHFLPKAGKWMNHIKHAFGIILLIIAISLAERISPPAITMLAWSALCIIGSIFLGLFDKDISSNPAKFAKGFSIILFGYGLLILIGVGMGSESPYRPIAFAQINAPIINSSNSPTVSHLKRNATQPAPIVIETLSQAQTVIKQAKLDHKEILVDFYADWCTACKEMDRTIFSDPAVLQILKKRVWLKVDLTKRNQNSTLLEQKFKIVAPPTLLFLSQNGKEIARIIGETDKKTVLSKLAL